MSICSEHYKIKDLPRALKRLQDLGLRLTKPREAMIHAILDLHRPFTTDELHTHLKQLKPSDKTDLATVYRSLSKFYEAGLLTSCHFGDGLLRYELTSSDGSHHHHIICTKCQKIEPLKTCLVQVQEKSLKKMGYKNLSHKLEFFGVCKTCII